MPGVAAGTDTGTTKALIVEACASRSEAPQFCNEQEPEAGQHTPAMPPGQHSMPAGETATTSGACNAATRESNVRTASALIAGSSIDQEGHGQLSTLNVSFNGRRKRAAHPVPANPSAVATTKVSDGRMVQSAPPIAAAPATENPRIA